MIQVATRVRSKFQDHPDVKLQVQELSEKFNSEWFDRKRRSILCLHEGTHLYFTRLCGFELELYGPSVSYDPDSEQFVSYDASVERLPDEIEMSADPVLVAKHFLAPAYVEEKLLDHRSWQQIWKMARDDLRNYNRWFCKRYRDKGDIGPNFPNIRELVHKDCRNPGFRRKVWDAAREFEERVFGLEASVQQRAA
jgi:hypothetical protein